MKTFFTIVILCCFLTVRSQETPKNSTIKGINHVSFSVRNLNRSVEFYTAAMALTEINRYRIDTKLNIEKKAGIQHISRNVAVLKGPNAYFELIEFDGASEMAASAMPVSGPGVTHVCYQIPNSKPIYDKIKTLGASIVSRGTKPVDVGGYGIQYAYAKDADGLMFEMEHFDKPKFTEDTWVGHVSIITPDIDRLVKFYTELLGIEPYNRRDIKNNPKLDDIANIDGLKFRVAWFKTGNMILEMMQFESPITPFTKEPQSFSQIGYHQIDFEVGDIKQEYNKLKNTVHFLSKPVSSKESSVILAKDPDGNLISLTEYKSNKSMSLDNLKRLEW